MRLHKVTIRAKHKKKISGENQNCGNEELPLPKKNLTKSRLRPNLGILADGDTLATRNMKVTGKIKKEIEGGGGPYKLPNKKTELSSARQKGKLFF